MHAPPRPLPLVAVVSRGDLPALAVPLALLPLPRVHPTHREGTAALPLALVVDELAFVQIAAAIDLHSGAQGGC